MGATATFDQFSNSLIASGDPYAMAAGAVMKSINQMVSSLGIGTGRNEADRIVPYQNELHKLLIVANDAMGAGASAARLNDLKHAVETASIDFQNYIQDKAQFPDGRASNQAFQTMFGNPGYARVTIENLNKTIAATSGSLDLIGGGGGSTSPLVLMAGIGLIGLMLLKK